MRSDVEDVLHMAAIAVVGAQEVEDAGRAGEAAPPPPRAAVAEVA